MIDASPYPPYPEGEIPPMIHDRSLVKLVERYRIECGERLDEYLTFFGHLPTVEEAIRHAYLTEEGRVHPHQRRVGKQICESACESLGEIRGEIEASESFEELHELIERQTRNLPRFGPLAVYDYALRIGSRLRPRLHPEAVYLHNGTRHGYRALAGHRGGETALAKDLPAPLHDLEPFHVENFLCIFADHLSGAAEGGQSPCVVRPRRRGVC